MVLLSIDDIDLIHSQVAVMNINEWMQAPVSQRDRGTAILSVHEWTL